MLKDIKLIAKYLKGINGLKLAFILTILSSIIGAVIPRIYGQLVDFAVTKKPFGFIALWLGIWLLLTLISSLIGRYTEKKTASIGSIACNKFLQEKTDHLLHLPLKYHKDNKMGEIVSKIQRANDFLETTIESNLFWFLPNVLTMLLALAILAFTQWILAVCLAAIIFLFVLISLKSTPKILKKSEVCNEVAEECYGNIADSIINVCVVKSNTNEELEEDRTAKGLKNIYEKYMDVVYLFRGMVFAQHLIAGIGFVIVFGVAILLLQHGRITPGNLVMSVGYISIIYMPMFNLSHFYRQWKRGMTVINRAEAILKVSAESYNIGGKELENVKGGIEFQDVSFGYNKEDKILAGLGVKIKAGEVVAIVGESGVGKTTMVDLISRFYSPQKGKILIDGIDIEKVGLKSLREQIAMVPQEITLFNDTVISNIRYGRIGATDKEVVEAAKQANAHEFIEKFPKKYNQLVGERGIKLSTGQKQRVAIARALLRNPRILILDEATSSQDSISEKLIHEALDKLIKGRTTLIIAHRLSTIKNADRILVIDNGKIVEEGKHDELILKDGHYKKLYSAQLNAMC